MIRTLVFVCLVLLFGACSQTDPYKRLAPAPTPELLPADAGAAFATRWPIWYKCVQTVTIDFGPVTRTLVGYLVVSDGGRFRLQVMSEQGLKLLDVARTQSGTHVFFAAKEFDDRLRADIVRDTERVFLPNGELTGGEFKLRTTYGSGTSVETIHPFPDADINSDAGGSRVHFESAHHDLVVHFVGDHARVDWYDCRQAGRSLYRIDQYEWTEFDGLTVPSTIVLREPGIQSNGPPYKLTIKVTEFSSRNKPWPERVFEGPKEGE